MQLSGSKEKSHDKPDEEGGRNNLKHIAVDGELKGGLPLLVKLELGLARGPIIGEDDRFVG